MRHRGAAATVASLGVIAPPSQGATRCEHDGHYPKDEPAHREAIRGAWQGRDGARAHETGPSRHRPAHPQGQTSGWTPARKPGSGWNLPAPPRPRRHTLRRIRIAAGDGGRRWRTANGEPWSTSVSTAGSWRSVRSEHDGGAAGSVGEGAFQAVSRHISKNISDDMSAERRRINLTSLGESVHNRKSDARHLDLVHLGSHGELGL